MKRAELIAALAGVPDDVEIVSDSDYGVHFDPNLPGMRCSLYVFQLTNPADGKTWQQYYTNLSLAQRDQGRESKHGLQVGVLREVKGVKI